MTFGESMFVGDIASRRSAMSRLILRVSGRFRNLKAIHRIQIIQRTISEIDLLYEGAAAGRDAELEAIAGEIRHRLGAQMRVTPKPVERVLQTGRGKRRLIVSLDEQSRGRHVHRET
jgi:hypothetical protein